jgi:3-isopropylmalate/(R)-2-methylmalate dehydratase small subunit
MADFRFKAQAWVFGSDIDTDQIVPGPYLTSPVEEQSQHAFEAISPGFAREFKKGGALVAGSNFGCGSSRESAPDVLKHLGVSVVIAESFARIFFRNAIAIGLPVLVCPGVTGHVRQGDEVEVDLEKATVTRVGEGKVLEGVALNEIMLASLRKGGLMKILSEP